MNITEPWSIVFAVGFVLYAGTRHHFEQKLKGVESVERNLDGIEVTLLALVLSGNILAPVVYLFSPWFDRFDHPLPHLVGASGAVVMAGSLWLFFRSYLELDRQWSVTLEIRKDHRIVREGVYRRVRHPMYAAVFGIGIAQALLLSNWVAGPAALISFAPLYLVRVPREEALMVAHFGDDYRDYMLETGRLFPRFRKRRPTPSSPPPPA